MKKKLKNKSKLLNNKYFNINIINKIINKVSYTININNQQNIVNFYNMNLRLIVKKIILKMNKKIKIIIIKMR